MSNKSVKMEEPSENSSESESAWTWRGTQTCSPSLVCDPKPINKKRTNETNQVLENIQKPFFLEERNPITKDDFLEWKNTMINWIWSVPEYKEELLKKQDLGDGWGNHKGLILDH